VSQSATGQVIESLQKWREKQIVRARAPRYWIIYRHRLAQASRTRHKLWIVDTVGETPFTIVPLAVASYVVTQRH
jgi:hypothetical protein